MILRYCWVPFFFAFALTIQTVAAQDCESLTEMAVPWVNVPEVRVNLRIREGNLVISRAADDLVRGVFSYKEGQEPPRLNFSSKGDWAQVDITGSQSMEQSEVYLTDRVPMSLAIEARAGSQRLILDDLKVQRLKLDLGTGNAAIQASNSALEDVMIQHHIGNLSIDFGRQMVALQRLQIRAGSGEIFVDLSGAREGSADVDINLESGSISVVLPQERASVYVDAPQGEVVTKGITRQSDHRFANGACDDATPHLNVKIHAHRGNVFLQGS